MSVKIEWVPTSLAPPRKVLRDLENELVGWRDLVAGLRAANASLERDLERSERDRIEWLNTNHDMCRSAIARRDQNLAEERSRHRDTLERHGETLWRAGWLFVVAVLLASGFAGAITMYIQRSAQLSRCESRTQ